MRLTVVCVRGWLLAGVGAGLVLAGQVARAQGNCSFTDENGKTVTWPNCQPPAGSPGADGAAGSATSAAHGANAPNAANVPNAPSAPKSFPYPGEKTAGGTSGLPQAPGAAASGSSAPAGNKFPYPGDPAAKSAGGSSGAQGSGGSSPSSGSSSGGSSSSGSPLQDAGSSGSSSSDEDGKDSAAGPLGDDDPAAQAAEQKHQRSQRHGIAFHQTADQREAEDLRVASFYQNDGNYRGAYERAADAVSIADDDAEAYLALADAARHMGKMDEAEKNYKKCLALDPVPKIRNAAQKALKEMSGGD